MDTFRIEDGVIFEITPYQHVPDRGFRPDNYVATIWINDGDHNTPFEMRKSWLRELGIYCLQEDILAIRELFNALVLRPLSKEEPLTETEKVMVVGGIAGLARRFDKLAEDGMLIEGGGDGQ